MVELIFLWIYILVFSTACGIVVLQLLGVFFKHNFLKKDRNSDKDFMCIQLAGFVFITCYAQAWSIFGRVYVMAHSSLLGLIVVLLAIGRFGKWELLQDCYKIFVEYIKRMLGLLFSWKGVLFLILVCITAYYSSRGVQHTDTYIYHAEAIRWYEEYGLVTGLGNLQNHFAYNSSYLGYCAFFAMRWLMGQSLHGAGGFLQALLVVYAVNELLDIRKHTCYLADATRIAVLIYAVVNSEYICWPATDFGALYLCLWVILLWVETATYESDSKDNVHEYALLCVAICCVLSMKLAAGMMVVIAVYPGIKLIRMRDIQNIIKYIMLGTMVLLPWIVRNVIISGYIVYPVVITKLSFLDWMIPVDYVVKDNSYISTWARCLYDVEMIDMPFKEWLPVWWAAKDTYEKMLIVSNVVGVMLEGVWILDCLCKKKINLPMLAMKGSVLLCLIVWFMKAPFIRYGLCFLLILPLIEIAQWIVHREMGPVRIITGFGTLAVVLTLFMYINYYTLYDMVIAKEWISEGCYLIQKDYEQVEHDIYDMDGMDIYYPVRRDDNSYAPIPSTAYLSMAERTTLRGDSLKDGFKPR